ncbi:hypothetical protein B0A50_05800 [Salinomyces thailandicus]|uniref:ESCRT-II complex subunit VPS25 n=1 Tax=Salinomyces thailandicus TaxID=706561 RepID=A0A4U0TV56_9PEZI|nr:hypothetical protein B0A50_05800 [Salinomyces thailandica]
MAATLPDTTPSSLPTTALSPLHPTSTPPTSTFHPPTHASFPPFYTLQPNLTTRARQLDLWSTHVTTYCAHHRIFRLNLSNPPLNLFSNPSIHRSLKTSDIRVVLDHMSRPENGPRIEWISAGAKGEQSSSCYVYWKTPAEWAEAIYGWVEATGQKGAVLTVYELREGDAVREREWREMDEELLRKALGVLVKRGKAQVFGQEENAGVKFF